MPRGKRWRGAALAALAISLFLGAAACSPEASRTRSGGLGADVGNRDYPLPEIHGAIDPAYRTPRVGKAVGK